jgi:hypothetical protein
VGHYGKSDGKRKRERMLESLYIAESIHSLVYFSGACLCNDSATEVFDDEISQ